MAFPPVLKDEQPSSVILRYMEGITKKIQKIADLQLEHEIKIWMFLFIFALHYKAYIQSTYYFDVIWLLFLVPAT